MTHAKRLLVGSIVVAACLLIVGAVGVLAVHPPALAAGVFLLVSYFVGIEILSSEEGD
jgi:hypothetical protein